MPIVRNNYRFRRVGHDRYKVFGRSSNGYIIELGYVERFTTYLPGTVTEQSYWSAKPKTTLTVPWQQASSRPKAVEKMMSALRAARQLRDQRQVDETPGQVAIRMFDV